MLLNHDAARAFMPYPAVAVARAPSGPLAGLTLAVKDLFDVAGYPTSAGNPVWLARSGVAGRSAWAVQRLLDAGASFVGKTITDDLAYSLNGRNPHFGTPRNPAAPGRITGGSSSGSAAAVAVRAADIALGTDTGGSVRAPASHCGLFGLRPTHGRIPLQGCFTLARSFDTCGLFARDPATLLRAAAVLLGEDAAPLPARPRWLWAEEAFALATPEAARAVRAAAGRLLAPMNVGGAEVAKAFEAIGALAAVVEAGTPASAREASDADGAAGPAGAAGEVRLLAPGPGTHSLEAWHWVFRRIQAAEAWREHRAFLQRYQPPLDAGATERFAFGEGLDPAQVRQDRLARRGFRGALRAQLGADGVLLLPTMPDVAPRLDEPGPALEAYRYRAVQLLAIAGLSGCPQLTLPLASVEGAPLGVSLLGPPGSDLSLVRLAAALVAG